MYLKVCASINYIFHLLLNSYTWKFNNHSKLNMTFYSSLPILILSVHLENTNPIPLVSRVKNLKIILGFSSSSLLLVQFISKSCWMYVQNTPRIQPLITSPLLPPSLKPQSSLVWIITIVFQLVSLLLFSFLLCMLSLADRAILWKDNLTYNCVFLPYSETTQRLSI